MRFRRVRTYQRSGGSEFPLTSVYVRSVLPQMPLYRKSVDRQTYISRPKIKINENCKLFDPMQKSVYGNVFLWTMKRFSGIVGKHTIATKVTRNRKAGWCYLWAGHHTGRQNVNLWNTEILLNSEAVMRKSAPASLFRYLRNGGFEYECTQRD